MSEHSDPIQQSLTSAETAPAGATASPKGAETAPETTAADPVNVEMNGTTALTENNEAQPASQPTEARGHGIRRLGGSADTRKDLGDLPIVVGITGHRDLCPEDVTPLEDGFRSVLQELQSEFPHTPLMLLSPLAEGADRLAARVALECGAHLVVPLPMPRDVYMTDFSSDDSRAEFMDLFEQADLHFELHLVHGTTDNTIQSDGTSRAHQYAHVGAYIVRHCQILVALWDGVHAEQEGGTSQIVRFMLEGVPNKYDVTESPLDPKKTGPVYHIATRRLCHPGTLVDDPNKLSMIFPKGYSSDAAALTAYKESRQRIEDFNRDSITLGRSRQDEIATSKGYVLPASKIETLHQHQREMLENYALADTLAQYFQKDTLRTLKQLFCLAFISLFCFVIYGERRQDLAWLALAICSPAPMYWINNRAKKGDFHAKHLDYRALAEGLRIQIFWHIAGLREPVAKHYLRKQRSELDWIRDAINTWNIPMESVHGKPDYETVQKHWVDDQKKYFQKTTGRNSEKVEAYEGWVRNLFTITGVLTGVLVVITVAMGFLKHLLGESGFENVQTFLMVAIVVLPGAAATLDGYSEKLAFAEQAKQYQRMRDLFEVASQQLTDSLERAANDQAHQVIQELGEEALAENGDWVLIHREREVEVPHTG